MMRPDGWDMRLRELVETWRGRRFEWGVFDCCTLACDAYEAVMLQPPPNKPDWTDLTSAEALLAQQSVEAWISASLGEPVAGWAYARRGDLVSVDRLSPGGLAAVGVCVGSLVACVGFDGLCFPPLSSVGATWRVGE